MISLPRLKQFLEDLMIYNPNLNVSNFDPKNGNGLQVRGGDEVQKIGVGVTASLQLFQKGIELGCDVIITHHGIRWPDSPHYQTSFQKRYSYLIENNLTLFAYHFLMDSHPEIGHNEMILRKLGIEDTEVYADSNGPWGRRGQLPDPTPINDIAEKCKDIFNQEDITLYKFGKDVIQNIVALSGSAMPYGADLEQLIETDVDLYITGVTKESTRELFREAERNFLAAGHYATERLGMLELVKNLEEDFDENVEVEFIELWNEF
jgi:dinuclear metal center YbgI/SA1388 family protein